MGPSAQRDVQQLSSHRQQRGVARRNAVFLNTTVTNTTASSALAVYPQARPLASDLNWKA